MWLGLIMKQTGINLELWQEEGYGIHRCRANRMARASLLPTLFHHLLSTNQKLTMGTSERILVDLKKSAMTTSFTRSELIVLDLL